MRVPADTLTDRPSPTARIRRARAGCRGRRAAARGGRPHRCRRQPDRVIRRFVTLGTASGRPALKSWSSWPAVARLAFSSSRLAFRPTTSRRRRAILFIGPAEPSGGSRPRRCASAWNSSRVGERSSAPIQSSSVGRVRRETKAATSHEVQASGDRWSSISGRPDPCTVDVTRRSGRQPVRRVCSCVQNAVVLLTRSSRRGSACRAGRYVAFTSSSAGVQRPDRRRDEPVRADRARRDLLRRPRAVAVGRPREPDLPVRERRGRRVALGRAGLRRLRRLGEQRPEQIQPAIVRREQHVDVAACRRHPGCRRRSSATASTRCRRRLRRAEQRAVEVGRVRAGRARDDVQRVDDVRCDRESASVVRSLALPMERAHREPRHLARAQRGRRRTRSRRSSASSGPWRAADCSVGEERRLVDAQLGIDPVLRVEEDLAVRLPDAILLVPLPCRGSMRLGGSGSRGRAGCAG